MKRLNSVLVGLALVATPTTQAQKTTQVKNPMNITLRIGNRTLKAALIDSETSRDFLSMLPLTLTLEDYASTEKIAYPPRKLSTKGAPAGSTPKAGDMAYYAPWGNLALFHKDFSYSSGLIILGKIEGNVNALRQPGKVQVIIEQVK